MPSSWRNSLRQKLNQIKKSDASGLPQICLIGIGNDLRGDDSVGPAIARLLSTDERFSKAQNLLILDGGSAPENHTGKLRDFHPDLVLFIDTANLDASPGTIQLIPLELIDGMSASSHSLPLSLLARYIISEFGSQVEVLGIQPAQNEFDTELSHPISVAVENMLVEMADLFI